MISSDIRDAAEVLWRYHCVYDPLTACDAIIGLGSYDLRVADRCAQLYRQGYAARIIFTGASGNWTHGLFSGSEAAAFAERAVEHGVSRDDMVLEETATNIGENITRSAEILGGSGRSAILVTKPQTQRRCHATAKKQWPAASTMTTAPLHGFCEQPDGKFTTTHLINEMVGDIHRIRTYPDAGFQIAQEMPGDVVMAYEMLISKGFTQHLPEGAETCEQ